MARFKDRAEALKLRTQGMSYSQIKKIMGINKSTLSYWLRNYPLSKERIRTLRDVNEARIEKFRETMRQKKNARLDKTYELQKNEIMPLNSRDIFIAGFFLYWGEGSKGHTSDFGLTNTDPAMIKFFIIWITTYFQIPKNKISLQLQLYKDMDIKKEIKFWSGYLTIPTNQFIKPYIKVTSSTSINHKGSFGHGTCSVRTNNIRVTEKILMTLKAISDQYTNMRL